MWALQPLLWTTCLWYWSSATLLNTLQIIHVWCIYIWWTASLILTSEIYRTGVFEDLGIKFTSARILLQSDRRALIASQRQTWLRASEPQTSISAQRRFSNIAPWPTHSLISDPKLRKRPLDLCLEELNILISQMCLLNAYVLSHDWPLTRLRIQYWPSSPLCPSCHLNHPPSLDLLISIHFGRNTCTKTHLINMGSQTKFSLNRLSSVFTHPLFVGFLLLL